MIDTFSELPISDYILQQLSAADFKTPTAIQALAIPQALSGRDVFATAQTGTGKTLGFLIPIMELLLKDATGVQALVLAPTRELAIQIAREYDGLRGKKLPRAATVVGGLSENQQIESIRRGARLVIATPGRLEDLMSRNLVSLKSVKVLVLDEADRMLDIGFLPAIRRIAGATPKERQTLCFSATLDASVAHLVEDYLRNPARLASGSTLKPASEIRLQAFEVSADRKLGLLQQLLIKEAGRSLVFTRTKRGAERLTQKLLRMNFSVAMVHGGRTQSQRNAALAGFQNGRVPVLVATDVAARGIHVDNIMHVINFDLPQMPEDFIHRVGRTGRAGALGKASTFFTQLERREVQQIERALSLRMERMPASDNLPQEERPKPVDTSELVAVQCQGSSKMMRLPGEVLQRYESRQ